MDRSTRTIGLTVFVLGICLLLSVFATCMWLFAGPAGRVLPGSSQSNLIASIGGLGSAAALMFIRIALLFVMALAGSMIAGRGAELYFGSRGHRSQDSAGR